jgi:hypothetical protein
MPAGIAVTTITEAFSHCAGQRSHGIMTAAPFALLPETRSRSTEKNYFAIHLDRLCKANMSVPHMLSNTNAQAAIPTSATMVSNMYSIFHTPSC